MDQRRIGDDGDRFGTDLFNVPDHLPQILRQGRLPPSGERPMVDLLSRGDHFYLMDDLRGWDEFFSLVLEMAGLSQLAINTVKVTDLLLSGQRIDPERPP